MNKLAHFFLDIDLRCSHEGLSQIIKKNKITIGKGEFVVFMNQKRTMIKMFCQGEEALLHYKKDGRILDPGIIRFLPAHCGGKKLNVEGAIKDHLTDLMQKKKRSA